MTPEVKQLLSRHAELLKQLQAEHRKMNASAERQEEICAEGRAVQFQLLLHMPCRAFFKYFNIN